MQCKLHCQLFSVRKWSLEGFGQRRALVKMKSNALNPTLNWRGQSSGTTGANAKQVMCTMPALGGIAVH